MRDGVGRKSAHGVSAALESSESSHSAESIGSLRCFGGMKVRHRVKFSQELWDMLKRANGDGQWTMSRVFRPMLTKAGAPDPCLKTQFSPYIFLESIWNEHQDQTLILSQTLSVIVIAKTKHDRCLKVFMVHSDAVITAVMQVGRPRSVLALGNLYFHGRNWRDHD